MDKLSKAIAEALDIVEDELLGPVPITENAWRLFPPEERPYHTGKDRKVTIEILSGMDRRGLPDNGIVKDLDAALSEV